eukprot:scaffold101438_cov66-Cyclotella_meneghiniana.AAC.5
MAVSSRVGRLLMILLICSNAMAFRGPQIHPATVTSSTSYRKDPRSIVQGQSFIVPRGGSLESNTVLKMSLISAIDTFYQTFPFASAFATCGVKASR